MNSWLKNLLFIALYVAGCTILAAFAGYLSGAVLGLAMTWENNRNPQLPAGSYWWWANFTGLLLMSFACLPGAIAGFLWGVAARFGKTAKAETQND